MRLILPHKIVGALVLSDGFPVYSKVFLYVSKLNGVCGRQSFSAGVSGMRVY